MASVYVVASCFCARASIVTRQASRQCPDRRSPWWIITGVLLFLGINKLVALQTVMFKFGSAAATTHGWYEYRRTVQALFAGMLALILLATGFIACWKWKSFAKAQPLAAAGVFLLVLLVMIRAANFTHTQELLHINLHDDRWGWLLEVGGTACLAYAAARAPAR